MANNLAKQENRKLCFLLFLLLNQFFFSNGNFPSEGLHAVTNASKIAHIDL